MKIAFLFLIIFLNSLASNAKQSYYLGVPDKSENFFQNLEQSEILIDQEESKVRICGVWYFNNGNTQTFEHSFDLENETVFHHGADVGRLSKFGFFFRLDSGSGAMSFDMGWNRGKGTFGLNYWNNILGGLFFLKGSIQNAPSENLKKVCIP